MTSEHAAQLAWSAINRGGSIAGDSPVMVGSPREESFGWIFFYTSKRFHETKDFQYAIAGNGPVIVNRETGEVTMLGTAGGVEKQIEEYRNNK